MYDISSILLSKSYLISCTCKTNLSDSRRSNLFLFRERCSAVNNSNFCLSAGGSLIKELFMKSLKFEQKRKACLNVVKEQNVFECDKVVLHFPQRHKFGQS